MRKVYEIEEGMVVGFPHVVSEGVKHHGWTAYAVFGKMSASMPEVHKSSKGTEYTEVLQIETYESNAIVKLASLGVDSKGHHKFAKTINDKGKEVYLRERFAGLNYYNIGLTKDGEVVHFVAEQPEAKKKASGFDSL